MRPEPTPFTRKQVVYGLVAAALFIVVIWGALGPGCAAYDRYQVRQDAANAVKVKHTEIEKAEEEAQVNRAQIKATEAEAEKKIAESIGLKKAQVEINKTLTPLYVQHEYVQALEGIAHSPNSTIVYIPTGPNGIPVVGAKSTP